MDHDAAQLPTLVVGPADVVRLRREVEALDIYLRQAAVRAEKTHAEVKLPKTSRMLDEVIRLNKLDLTSGDYRQATLNWLNWLLDGAPVVHVSFAADPSSAFTDRVVAWFRQNIHPQVLVTVGLQPTIAAGCVVRTPNKYFDLSLRSSFDTSRPILIEKLRSLTAHVG